MRAYWNNTNKFITYKVWTLSAERVTQNNLTSIVSKGIEATIVSGDPQVVDWSGNKYRYSSGIGRVEFQTTCEEQELVLKLLYGTDLMLLMVNTVAPQSQLYSDA